MTDLKRTEDSLHNINTQMNVQEYNNQPNKQKKQNLFILDLSQQRKGYNQKENSKRSRYKVHQFKH
ncbi:hypothetical protein BLOT_007553 [Blomia tropicalis]|nr:hypothetical protein BLOT_007553 [Blomia tropicalis]